MVTRKREAKVARIASKSPKESQTRDVAREEINNEDKLESGVSSSELRQVSNSRVLRIELILKTNIFEETIRSKTRHNVRYYR